MLGTQASASSTGDAQHPRLVGAEPDRDVVGRLRTRVQSLHLVVLAGVGERAAAPHAPDDRDRLDQCIDGLLGTSLRSAGRHDRVPERSCAESEFHSAAGDQVESRRRLGKDHRWSQRQARDIGAHAQRGGAGADHREQRPGVEEPGLVRVVLHRHQVEAGHLSKRGQVQDALHVVCRRCREQAELDVMAVVGHRSPRSGGVSRSVHCGPARIRTAARTPSIRGCRRSPHATGLARGPRWADMSDIGPAAACLATGRARRSAALASGGPAGPALPRRRHACKPSPVRAPRWADMSDIGPAAACLATGRDSRGAALRQR